MTNETKRQLLDKGWVEGPHGIMSHPSRLGAAPGSKPERVAQSRSKRNYSRKGKSKVRVGLRVHEGPILRVTFVARSRPGTAERHDSTDNLAAGLLGTIKPLRDAIAASFGLDDHESTICWKYDHVEGEGPEGVVVMIEAI